MTPRDRRALILGLGVVGAALLGLRVVPWALREARARSERLAARRELLMRTRIEIREADALADSVTKVETRLVALAPTVLVGGREPDAVADLARRITAAATDQRVRVVRSVAVPDTVRAGRLRRVTLQTSLEGDAHGALGLLARLDAASAVTVIDIRLTALDPASAPNAPEIVAGELLARGWFVASATPEEER